MAKYAVLFRGINVGGRNKVPMELLRNCLEEIGFDNVQTYIASGNAIVESNRPALEVTTVIEGALPERFELDSEQIRVLVLTREYLQSVVDQKPEGFGEQPEMYRSDAVFLLGIDSSQALRVLSPREGVDKVWAGKGVIYSQRLSSRSRNSRLSKIAATPEYKSMTIRNWNTTTTLLEMLKG